MIKKPRKTIEEEGIENIEFNFSTPFTITEAGVTEGRKWLKIGGIALEEGVSANLRQYTIQNLAENDGKSFKWLFGHPRISEGEHFEPHIVGMGKLKLDGNKLIHEGMIRNTAQHPDVVEAVQDGFLGPSIHGFCKKISKKDGKLAIEGLDIGLIALVAVQGVKNASIDYAIAESFDKKMNELAEASIESDEVANNTATEEPKMDETKPVVAEAKPATPAVSMEEYNNLKSELATIKEAKKKDLVGQICEMNKKLKAEDLLKETEDHLKLVLEYEMKLAQKPAEAAAVVEDNNKPEVIGEAKDGSISLTEEAYKKFNKELKERVI
jgi:hypothetical protein